MAGEISQGRRAGGGHGTPLGCPATLAFLHHEVVDSDGDETEPFVTLVPLERLLVGELDDPRARSLELVTD